MSPERNGHFPDAVGRRSAELISAAGALVLAGVIYTGIKVINKLRSAPLGTSHIDPAWRPLEFTEEDITEAQKRAV